MLCKVFVFLNKLYIIDKKLKIFNLYYNKLKQILFIQIKYI